MTALCLNSTSCNPTASTPSHLKVAPCRESNPPICSRSSTCWPSSAKVKWSASSAPGCGRRCCRAGHHPDSPTTSESLMLKLFKKIKYGVRVLLSKSGGQPETIDLHGRPTVIMHGGEGPPFVYLHSTLNEAFMWFPFYQTFA